jgi:lipopolysaccharide/colanic/teichoic acid biosynthesis glycosyltransferase
MGDVSPSLHGLPKRVLDVVVATSVLVVSVPLVLVIAIALRVMLGRPILFAQPRPGRERAIFTMYKFRTMTDARDESGHLLHDAVRQTRIGRILRATSLDELPSLWNVLRGEMSLVGPRPLSVKYLPLYTADQDRRHLCRPGVTGLAQVVGRNQLSWDERFELDVWYIENHTFALDLRILWKTAVAVMSRRGVLPGGAADRENFRGARTDDPTRRSAPDVAG